MNKALLFVVLALVFTISFGSYDHSHGGKTVIVNHKGSHGHHHGNIRGRKAYGAIFRTNRGHGQDHGHHGHGHHEHIGGYDEHHARKSHGHISHHGNSIHEYQGGHEKHHGHVTISHGHEGGYDKHHGHVTHGHRNSGHHIGGKHHAIAVGHSNFNLGHFEHYGSPGHH